MIIERYENVASFYAKTRSLLERNESANNLPLGILQSSLSMPSDPDHVFVNVESGRDVLLSAQQIDRAMIVTGDPQYSSILAAYITDNKIRVNALLGESILVKLLAEELAARDQISWEIKMNQKIFKLTKLNDINLSPGAFRVVGLDDLEIIARFIQAFGKDIGEEETEEAAMNHAKKNIEKQIMFVWDHNGVVSMARKARPSANGVVINAVYTPPEHRGKGYASSCVASLSKKLLKEFKFCSLYTDLSNPTSNKIYQKIGFNPVMDSNLISINYNS